jgi:hypothetical protein
MTIDLWTDQHTIMSDEVCGIAYQVACTTPPDSDLQRYARFLAMEIAEKVMNRLIEYEWRPGS